MQINLWFIVFWPLGIMKQCHHETQNLVLVQGQVLKYEWSVINVCHF